MKRSQLVIIALLLYASCFAQIEPALPDNCLNPTISDVPFTYRGCVGATFNVTPSVTLPTGFSISGFSWSPSTGITPPSAVSGGPGIFPTTATFTVPAGAVTHTLAVLGEGPELIRNGDFRCSYPVVLPGGSVIHDYYGFNTQYQDFRLPSGGSHGHIKIGNFEGASLGTITCMTPRGASTSIPGSGYTFAGDVESHSGYGCNISPTAPVSTWSSQMNVRGTNGTFGRATWEGFPRFGYINEHSALAQPGYFWGQNVKMCNGAKYHFSYWIRQMDGCASDAQRPEIEVAFRSDYAACPASAYAAENEFGWTWPRSMAMAIPATSGTNPYIPTFYTDGTFPCENYWRPVSFDFTYTGPTGNIFICMFDNNTAGTGNAFGIDDISLKRVTRTPAPMTVSPYMAPAVAVSVTPGDGFPCTDTNPFILSGPVGTSIKVIYSIGSTTYTSPPFTGSYTVPYTSLVAGSTHTITLLEVEDAYGCRYPITGSATATFITKPTALTITGLLSYYCTGDDIYLTANATYAAPGLYGTSYSWSWPSGLVLASGVATDQTIHLRAIAPSGGMVTCVIMNRCGQEVVTTDVLVNLTPSATASAATPCNPICPGNAISILITGSSGATVNYSYQWPGSPGPTLGSVILPAGGGTTFTTVTFTSPSLTVGTFQFKLIDVTLTPCSKTYGTLVTVGVDYPSASLSLIGPSPCAAVDNYTIRVTGPPGARVYLGESIPYDIAFPVYVDIPLTGPSYIDIGGLFFPEFGFGVNTFCISKIEMHSICGGCTVETAEGYIDDLHHPLPCLNVTSRAIPSFSVTSSGPFCVGSPFDMTLDISSAGERVTNPHTIHWTSGPTSFFDLWSDADPVWTYTTSVHSEDLITVTTGAIPTPGIHVMSVSVTGNNGCTVTKTVTVNAGVPVPPITGPSAVCPLGQYPITLSNSMPGGTWNTSWPSSAVTITPLGTSCVVAGGVTSGIPLITYSIAGCYVTHSVSLHPNATLYGNEFLCHDGATEQIYLANPMIYPVAPSSLLGGTWNSSNPAVISVSSGGIATRMGSATGTATITYTMPGTGCFSTLTINAVAGVSISGPLIGCGVGSTLSLSASTPGGSWWISGTSSVATISSSGVVTFIGTGTALVQYCLNPQYGNIYFPLENYTNCCVDVTVSNPCSGRPAPDNDLSHGEIGLGALSIVPNPNTGTFTIQGNITVADHAEKQVKIEIVDMLGKIMQTDYAEIENGSISKQMSLSEKIARGVYSVRLMNGAVNQVVKFILER